MSRMSRLARFNTLLGIVGFLSLSQSAHADSFTLGNINHPFFISATNMTVRPGEILNVNHQQDMGGDAKGVLNGELLAGTYCVNITDPVFLNAAYNDTVVTTDGTVFGESINNAGAISWLMTNFAASALTDDQQNGLQAAIWRAEYGSGFELDGADNAKPGNTPGIISAYQAYSSALGSNTAPISDVLWISPVKNPSQGGNPPASTTSHYQGLVGIRAVAADTAAPEPGSIALFVTGILPIAGLVVRRRDRK